MRSLRRVTPAARKPVLGLDPRSAAGPPEAIVKEKRSYAGRFLAEVLARRPAGGVKRGKAQEAAE